ncbi:hypothetical protein SPRG_04810 [Saprolegnia parasitica CBS 223.65]|uniref:Enoyl reductase (ER) domain-containing protein n=1 Tax=Saprolegnia parasitica (strain CBS 223.65) TaxID=695850 RepID=A0A067CVS8_SAPPC|nr:hypothetical protein SPRG_04810 [Saprolegnia parasitica CBS 223.65]KDO30907.1 hypothetical protein SPRG_04810 [Saprolegnia parasitica CBS 223.65]|eukprot:XP_012198600.1 hypothetical protein SPRG_04810 [Saprolegnia parasitica CBS 223.65]
MTPTTMRALVYSAYGPASSVLSLKEIAVPSLQPGHVLVKIGAFGLNAADKILLAGTPFPVRLALGGIFRPRADSVLGADFAGTIEALGDGVTSYKVGDEVYGEVNFATGAGAFAEYVCVPADSAMALKPKRLSFAQAAAMPISGQTALLGLRDGLQLQAGQRILINGASGGVGTFAVQIAKALGGHVTAVCSTGNVAMVRELGADDVIDYTIDDFVAKTTVPYDAIFDVMGNRSMRDFRRLLVPRGTYLAVGGDPATFFSRTLCLLASKVIASQSLRLCISAPSHALLTDLAQLVDQGLVTPCVEKEYDLSDGVAAIVEAHEKHAKGKRVVKITPIS